MSAAESFNVFGSEMMGILTCISLLWRDGATCDFPVQVLHAAH